MSATEPTARQVGEYRLLERLGEGGMGVVHRALDPRGRPVAVKVMRPHIAHDEAARRRLAREVDVLARVRHERVAAVLDADVDGEAPFVVTEFVPGVPLDDLVDQHGPLAMNDLVSLGEGLAEALTAIHRAGIVHRDLKPGNIMMVDGEPVVIDFGIAQVGDDVRLTMTGMVMGTPGYLSPELVEGGEVTTATDWWGWAACLTYAASGNPPFGRGPMAVVLDRVTRGKPDLTGVDERLQPLLASALSINPRHRPDAEEVIEALRALAEDRPVTEVLRTHRPTAPTAGAGFQQPPAAAGGGPTAGLPVTPEESRPATRPSAVGRWPGGPDDGAEETASTRALPVARPPSTQAWPQAAPTRDPRTAPGAGQDQRPMQSAPPQGWAGGHSGPAARYAPYGAPPQRPQQPPPSYDPQQPGAGYAGAPGAGWQGGSPDPRAGRPMRSGVLAAGLALVIALVAVVPYVGLGTYLLWSVVARTVDRSMSARVVRRHTNGGARRSDTAVSVAASPWHLFIGAVQGVICLILPLGVAAVAAAAAGYGLGVQGSAAFWMVPAVLAMAAFLLAVMSWWGPGGTSLRRGSRSLVRAVAPSDVTARIVAGVLLLGAVGLLLGLGLTASEPSWWPATGFPLPDLAWWDRLLP